MAWGVEAMFSFKCIEEEISLQGREVYCKMQSPIGEK